MTANELTATLLIEIPKRFPQCRVWRQNTGGGVGMDNIKKAISLIGAGKPAEAISYLRRPIKFGVRGGGDISGIAGTEYALYGTSMMIGLRLEIEVKVGRDKPSEEQQAFRKMIEDLGGIYIIARSIEESLEELGRRI
jgi:hypothetical protein